MASPTLREITDRIRKEAGFEVHFYEAYPDALKLDLPEGIDKYSLNGSWTRCASHNMRVDRDFGYNDPRFAQGCFYQLGGKPFPRDDNLGIVGKGVSWKLKKEDYQVPGGYADFEVPRGGILGKLGFKKIESQREMMTKTRQIHERPYTLSETITTEGINPASITDFVLTNILADVRDHAGRNNGKANLIVYCEPALKEEIVNFLEENPNLYGAYHRALLSQEQFPNTYKRMISQMKEPSNIAFMEVAPGRNPEFNDDYYLNESEIERVSKVVQVRQAA